MIDCFENEHLISYYSSQNLIFRYKTAAVVRVEFVVKSPQSTKFDIFGAKREAVWSG
jgi:hypothetical protein